jgi:ubiquinone/menaquinone biosynthesis C-methylase UbiE
MSLHADSAGPVRGRSWPILFLLGAVAVGLASLAIVRTQERDDWPDEASRLASVIALQPDMTLAEVGAGHGELTVEMAKRLGPGGRLFSTEIDPRRLEDIRAAVERAGLANVTVITAGEREANLPAGCCDAIFMREVYHHFSDPQGMVESLRRALKPGGMLVVIDFPSRGPSGANCHCIDKAELTRQVTAHGFEPVGDEDRWSGTRYLAAFRRQQS